MLICIVMPDAARGVVQAESGDSSAVRPFLDHLPARRYLWPALVAFFLRIEWMLIAGTYALYRGDAFDPWLYGFEMGSVARSLSHGLGYSSPFYMFVGATGPTAWVTPLYPLLISAVIRVFGDFSLGSVLVLLGLNCALSALTCILIYRIAEAAMGRRVAWLAAWTWALVPYFNRWHPWIWDVNLSALLLATMFWLTLRAGEDGSWRSEVWLGGAAGLAVLSNPTLLIFLPVSLLWIACRRYKRNAGALNSRSHALDQHVLRPFLVVGAMVAILAMPWVVRNRMAFGQWVFLRTNFGTEFYLTNQHALAPTQWITRHPSLNWDEGTEYRTLGELAYNRDRMARAVRYVREYPGEFASVTMKRVVAFWSGSIPTVFSDDHYWRFRLYVPLSVLGIAGLAITFARRNAVFMLYFGLLLLYPAVFYITYPVPRQRHAIEPILLVLACYAMSEFLFWIPRRIQSLKGLRANSRLAAGAGWFAVVLLLVSCGVAALQRARARHPDSFVPQPTLSAERFTAACGRPEQYAASGDVVELDYQKAQVRVRIIAQTYGWVFDRRSGDLITAAQSLACWQRSR